MAADRIVPATSAEVDAFEKTLAELGAGPLTSTPTGRDGINALLVVMTRDLAKTYKKGSDAIVVIVRDKKARIPSSVKLSRPIEDVPVVLKDYPVGTAFASAVIQCQPDACNEGKELIAEAELKMRKGATLLFYVDGASEFSSEALQGIFDLITNSHSAPTRVMVRITYNARTGLPADLTSAIAVLARAKKTPKKRATLTYTTLFQQRMDSQRDDANSK